MLLALIFIGIGIAEAQPAIGHANYSVSYAHRGAMSDPWSSIDWLTSRATVFTNAGLQWLTAKLDESIQTTGDFMGWGTGTHTAAVTDTALTTEDTGGSPTYARVTSTRTIVTTTKTNDTVQWVASITSNGTKTIKEAANFTASSAGTMLVYGDWAGTSVLLNDIIQITNTLQFTN